MAERSSGSRASSRRNGHNAKLTGRDAIERVRDELPGLLGKPIEAVLGLERDEQGGWQVTVQVIELSRVPSSTDVLGSYAVTLSSEGELDGYRRLRRYGRNQPDED